MAKSDTKQRLIDAAMDLFSTKGYDGTSVDEIAEYIGIKGPTIYKYFKGKEALLEALMNQADEEYDKGVIVASKEAESITTSDEFKTFALQSLMVPLENPTIQKMRKLFTIEQYRSETFAQKATIHQLNNVRDMYAKIFKRLMNAGIMLQGNPSIVALEFTAPNTVMIQLYDREPNKKAEVLSIFEEHVNSFIDRYFL